MNKNSILEDTLKDLLHSMKVRQVVKNIVEAKDVNAVYLQEKEDIKRELNDFIVKLGDFMERKEFSNQKVPYEDVPEFINKDNVVDLCFALIMTETYDDIDLILDTRGISKLLSGVEGRNEGIAKKLNLFLYNVSDEKFDACKVKETREWNKDGFFSKFTYDEILERIVS